MARTGEYKVTIDDEEAYIYHKLNVGSTIFGNLALLPFAGIGLLVDFRAGGAWSLEPKQVEIRVPSK